ncbi:hypothetical protein AB0H88_27190 [Nonomuraea sp. NPDC050680]|uniref:hypothetical protein n=1 Tax=Nonomuraea sp. NPDC050680 TaxID=3154630 RepID=UPI0033C0BC18
MPDLLWDDVKALFDPEVNGALPDVVVEGTTVEDWQVLLDLVQAQGWQYAYSAGGEPMDLHLSRSSREPEAFDKGSRARQD